MSHAFRDRKPANYTLTSSSLSSSILLRQFVEFIPLDIDIEKARQITLKGKRLTALPSNVGALLREVRRMDLSDNDIYDVTPLASLQHLTSINISKNKRLLSIAPFKTLHLTVCVVAHCNLRSLIGLEGSASTLKTLIVNDNSLVLQSPTGGVISDAKSDDVSIAVGNYKLLELLSACETVVFSRNPQLCGLYTVPVLDEKEGITRAMEKRAAEGVPHHEADWSHPLSVIEKMLNLRKLSLSGCGLTSLPSHWFLPRVTELRLSNNALKSLVPEGVIFRSVKILDVSHNKLETVSTLRRCRFVRQLSISGNPFLKETETVLQKDDRSVSKSVRLPSEIIRFLTRKMPHLEMVDSTPLSTILIGGDTREDASEKGDAMVDEDVEDVTVNKDIQASIEEVEDVVVVPPEAVVGATQPPIVRRERTNLLAQRKRDLEADGAAVAQLVMKRRTEVTGW